DIAQNQATQLVRENAFSARLDFKVRDNWSAYVRVFRDDATNDEPQGVTGRRFYTTSKPTNAVVNVQGILGNGAINELKFGYNSASSTERGITQPGFENISLSLGGSV